MLINSTSDPNETVYFKKNSIDRSIGYLIGGIVVLSCFMLFLFGLGRVQTMSDQAVSTQPSEPEQEPSEIGDTPRSDGLR